MRITLTICIVLWVGAASAHDVVVKRNSNLRQEPSVESDIFTLLKPGDEAKLLDLNRQNGYYRVSYKDGIGWVWGRNVQIYPEYVRSHWKHWVDADGDCQKARDEVLIAESEIPVTFETTDSCKVKIGRWTDPYTGQTFTDAGDLQVDHMVPLQNAHRAGGWAWSRAKRETYANDLDHPEHLIAVSGSVNQSKGSRGSDKWTPPNDAYHCQYAKDWEAIKVRWELEISDAEQAALDEMKATCP